MMSELKELMQRMRETFDFYVENENLDEEEFEKTLTDLAEEIVVCLKSDVGEDEISACLQEIQTYLSYLSDKETLAQDDMSTSKTLQNGINTYTKKMIEIQ